MILDQTFKNQNYTQNRLPKGEYENCIFEGCNFEQGFLDNQNFMECEFIDCNLSNTNITNSIFKEVAFEKSKMVGLKFETCNDFLIDFSFNECNLNYSSFYKLELKNQRFNDCNLKDVDFTDTVLKGANFSGSDLSNAIFSNTKLQKADFSKALNFTIDPEKNALKSAKFSHTNIKGLLHKYNIAIT